MSVLTATELGQLARRIHALACEAGTLALDRPQNLEVETKSSSVDLVTQMDQRVESFLRTGLRQLRPEDGIVGEEASAQPADNDYTWYVDPIDGTTNYVYGQPQWALSLALAYRQELQLGAVVAPQLGQAYIATRGGGAWLRPWDTPEAPGKRLRVNPVAALERTLVATGFGYAAPRRARQAQALLQVLPQVRDIRRGGSAALDLCQVAAGQVDSYYELGINVWDYAAGAVVAAEAGACLGSTLIEADGAGPDKPTLLVAANADIYPRMTALVETAFAAPVGSIQPAQLGSIPLRVAPVERDI